ncbi:unnamed protein product [Arctogadus glacialis]
MHSRPVYGHGGRSAIGPKQASEARAVGREAAYVAVRPRDTPRRTLCVCLSNSVGDAFELCTEAQRKTLIPTHVRHKTELENGSRPSNRSAPAHVERHTTARTRCGCCAPRWKAGAEDRHGQEKMKKMGESNFSTSTEGKREDPSGELTFQSRRFSSAEPSLAPSSASWLLKGQLGHGDSRTRVSRPCFLGSPHLEGGVGRVGAGDSYSSAVTADGELVLWGRIPSLSGDADPKVFQRLWSPQPVPLEGMRVLEVACGTWHMMALVTEQRHHPKHIRKKVSPGVHFVNPRAVTMGCGFQGPHRHPTNAAVAATPATPPRPTRHGP